MPKSWPLALICLTHRSNALLIEFAPRALTPSQVLHCRSQGVYLTGPVHRTSLTGCGKCQSAC